MPKNMNAATAEVPESPLTQFWVKVIRNMRSNLLQVPIPSWCQFGVVDTTVVEGLW